jgi:jumonji domain-containing protein 2
VPPNGWKGKASNYSEKLEGLLVSGPIEQNIFGKGGIYECLHIQKKSLTLR